MWEKVEVLGRDSIRNRFVPRLQCVSSQRVNISTVRISVKVCRRSSGQNVKLTLYERLKPGLGWDLEDLFDFSWKVRVERYDEPLGLCENRFDPDRAFKDDHAGDFIIHIYSGHPVGIGQHRDKI